MAALSGTLLASRIVPTDSLDEFATHDEFWGRGGHRTCSDITERDAITSQRRKTGMTVYVESEDKEYRLKGGITNLDWYDISCCTPTLDIITEIRNTDFFVLERDGILVKVSALNAKAYFGGAIEEVGEVLFNGERVTFNGETVVYNGEVVAEQEVLYNGDTLLYNSETVTYTI